MNGREVGSNVKSLYAKASSTRVGNRTGSRVELVWSGLEQE